MCTNFVPAVPLWHLLVDHVCGSCSENACHEVSSVVFSRALELDGNRQKTECFSSHERTGSGWQHVDVHSALKRVCRGVDISLGIFSMMSCDIHCFTALVFNHHVKLHNCAFLQCAPGHWILLVGDRHSMYEDMNGTISADETIVMLPVEPRRNTQYSLQLH